LRSDDEVFLAESGHWSCRSDSSQTLRDPRPCARASPLPRSPAGTPGRPPLDREAPECQTGGTGNVDDAALPRLESAHAWLGGRELDHPAPHLGKAGGNAAHGVSDGGGESRRFCH
jgi:hypothetical protein